jgi:hypothetical protein
VSVEIARVRTDRWRLAVDRRLHRAWQFARAVCARPDAAIDLRLRRLLGNVQYWSLIDRLAPYDRAHHLRVYDLLVHGGESDPDLLLAALLHDCGKADARGRVRLGHRVAVVVLRSLAPDVLKRLDHDGLPGPLHGVYLGEHHARLGAALAARAGAPRNVCNLIANHECREPIVNAQLRSLIRADERATT